MIFIKTIYRYKDSYLYIYMHIYTHVIIIIHPCIYRLSKLILSFYICVCVADGKRGRGREREK